MTDKEEIMIPVTYHDTAKVKIASDVDGYPYWRPFLPMIEFCLDRGCVFTDDTKSMADPFYEDRNGTYSCTLAGPITLDDIRDNFDLPDHFETGVPYKNSISDMKHRCDLTLMSKADWEEVQRKSQAAKSRRNKLKAVIASKKAGSK